jgi:DNA-binding response OmpR family regulator
MSINYTAAEAMVYDPVGSNRNTTRTNLHSLGFRTVDPVASMDVFERRLRERTPDLILCEAAGTESELCQLVQTLRQGKIAENPFTIVVVTSWRRDGDLVGHVLNSGADDLLARPFSTQQLGERLRAHIDRRKQFVVTSDYIGPDRRREPGRAGAECFDVPNTLRIRALDRTGDAERMVASEVKRGKDQINREKLRRDAFQLCVQWRKFEQRRADAPDFPAILDRIEQLADDIDQRAEVYGAFESKKWCDGIRDSSRTIRGALATATKENKPPELGVAQHLLGHAALALGQIFAPGEVRPSELVELDAVVARADVRQLAGRGGYGPASVPLSSPPAVGRAGASRA